MDLDLPGVYTGHSGKNPAPVVCCILIGSVIVLLYTRAPPLVKIDVGLSTALLNGGSHFLLLGLSPESFAA